MHYGVCRTAGYSAFGPPPDEVIGPIARADMLAYHADELSWGLANAPERYAVLNACRARLYLTDGASSRRSPAARPLDSEGSGRRT